MTILYNKAKMVEHLSDVASVIQLSGWCRCATTNLAGQHCILGAHLAAIDWNDKDDVQSSRDFATALGFESVWDMTTWNDVHADDVNEVLELVMYSIERLVQTA